MFAPNLAGVAAAREEINQRALSAEPVLITLKQATALGMVGLNPSDLNKFERAWLDSIPRTSTNSRIVEKATIRETRSKWSCREALSSCPNINSSVHRRD